MIASEKGTSDLVNHLFSSTIEVALCTWNRVKVDDDLGPKPSFCVHTKKNWGVEGRVGESALEPYAEAELDSD